MTKRKVSQMQFYANIFKAIFAAIEANPNAETGLELETILNNRAALEFQKLHKTYYERVKSGHDNLQKLWKKYNSAA